MLSKKEIEKAIIWVKERLEYIAQNCDLKDKDNKRALDNLKVINICLQENNKQNKMIYEMAKSLYLEMPIEFYNEKGIEKQTITGIKQYFEKKVEEKKC